MGLQSICSIRINFFPATILALSAHLTTLSLQSGATIIEKTSKRYFDVVDHGEGVSRLRSNTKGSSSARMERFYLVSLEGRELARVEQR